MSEEPRIAIKEVPGKQAEWSDDPVPQQLSPETFGGWCWLLEIGVKKGPASSVFPSRMQAYEDAKHQRETDLKFDGLPIVDWLTGDELSDDTA
jgi:hypothetical protein